MPERGPDPGSLGVLFILFFPFGLPACGLRLQLPFVLPRCKWN